MQEIKDYLRQAAEEAAGMTTTDKEEWSDFLADMMSDLDDLFRKVLFPEGD